MKNLQKLPLLWQPGEYFLKEDHLYQKSGFLELVLAPLLFSWTVWILRRAREDGVERLYFLARDGYVSYRIACGLCRKYKIDMECRYLYCSRYSLRVPMYSRNIDQALDLICSPGPGVSLRRILIRAGLEDESIRKMEGGFPEIDPGRILTRNELIKVHGQLQGDREFLNFLKKASLCRWDALQSYLKQEGFLEDGRIGIVDSGWSGMTQKLLMDVLVRCKSPHALHGYYFGLYERPEQMAADLFRSYYFSPDRDSVNKVSFSCGLFEALLCPGLGTTIGYRCLGDRVEPVLKKVAAGRERRNICGVLEQYASRFMNFCSREELLQLDPKAAGICLGRSLRLFMRDPLREEAEIFGQLSFSADLRDEGIQEVAPPLDRRGLAEEHLLARLLSLTGVRRSCLQESSWYEGSAVRSSSRPLFHLFSCTLYKMLRTGKNQLMACSYRCLSGLCKLIKEYRSSRRQEPCSWNGLHRIFRTWSRCRCDHLPGDGSHG